MSNIPGLNTAILDFCTRLDDGPVDETRARREIPKRDPAEYAWLREAMASIEQPESRLKKLLVVMNDPVECDAMGERGANALEETADMVEDLNLATEYDLMGGPAKTIKLIIATKDTAIRRQAAMIIGQASQNHERVQKAFTGLNFQDALIPLLASETDAATRAALIFAISCVCRAYIPSSAAFLKAGGLGVLLSTIQLHAYTDPKSTARCFRLAEYFAADLATTAAPVAQISCRLAVAATVPKAAPTSAAGDANDNDDGAAAAAAPEEEEEEAPAPAAASSSTAAVEPPKGPTIDVTTAAAGCARAILDRCVDVGEPGAALAGECVGLLAAWMERRVPGSASDDDTVSEDHKGLADAYRRAIGQGVAATASTNKAAPSSSADVVIGGGEAAAAPAAQPMLALPGPRPAAPASQ